MQARGAVARKLTGLLARAGTEVAAPRNQAGADGSLLPAGRVQAWRQTCAAAALHNTGLRRGGAGSQAG